MRSSYNPAFRIVAALLVTVVPAAALLASGCGGDDTSPGTTANDGSTPDAPSADVAVDVKPGAVTITASDVTVYVSTPAHLDAVKTQGPAASDPVTFAWTVTSVPPKSAVTSQSLQNATTAKPTLVPDLAGDYVLSLTATSAGASATKAVTVHAQNAYVFYTTTKADDVSPYFEFDVVQSDGTGAHAVACRQRTFALPPNSQDAGSVDFSDGGAPESGAGTAFLMLSAYSADFNLDVWEGPPGTPGRGAFQAAAIPGDGGPAVFSLLAATSDNTCQTPPTPIRAVAGSQPSIFQPRFSPDGKRVAYVEQRSSNDVHIASVGFDGTDYHDFGNICGDAGSGCFGSTLTGDRPQWLDSTHLAWLIQTNGYNTPAQWSVLTAPDTNNATASTYMTCTGQITPRGFAFLPDGSVVANYMAPSAEASVPNVEDLVVFKKDVAGNCTLTRKLTNLTTPGSYARDFSVSPDGSMVAFVQFTAPATGYDASNAYVVGGDLFLVPTDGSAAPHAVGGAGALHAFFGARWIAGGSRLAWNGTAPPAPDASFGSVDASAISVEGGLPAMNVIAVDGSAPVHVVQSDPGNALYVFGGGNGGGCSFQANLCNISYRSAGSTAAALVWSGLSCGAFFVRRRARKTNKK